MFIFNLSLLTYSDFMGTQGIYGEEYDRLDFDDVLAALLWQYSGISGLVPVNEVDNLEHYHIEDELNPVFLVGAYTAATDTFVPTAANYADQAALNRVMRYNSNTGGNSGVMLVAENNPNFVLICGSEELTLAGEIISAMTGGSVMGTDADVADGTRFRMSLPKGDGEKSSPDTSRPRSARKSYVRVYERGVEISETRQHIMLYGISREDTAQIRRRTMEIFNELTSTFVNERAITLAASTAGGADLDGMAARRRFPGVIQQLINPGLTYTAAQGDDDDWTMGGNAVNAGGALTTTDLDVMVENLDTLGAFDAIGADHAIICHPRMKKILRDFNTSARTLDNMEEWRKVGFYVDTYVSALGGTFPVVTDRSWPLTVIGMLDMSRIKRNLLRGDDLHLSPMAKDGRTDRWQLSCQYGAKVESVPYAGSDVGQHSMIYGITGA